MRTKVLKIATWGALLTVAAGCSQEPPPNFQTPDAFPFVQAKVQMDGKVVENAVVTLQDAANKDRKIIGAFDSDTDTYRFVTTEGTKQKAGVPEGNYKVVIRPSRTTRVKIPAKYGKPETTDLTASIMNGDNYLEPFDLKP